jgi:putative transposase
MSTAHLPTPDHLFSQRVVERNLYRGRNKIERIFSRLKQLRRLATHYGNTAGSFLQMGGLSRFYL